jgi:hypothetical protein
MRRGRFETQTAERGSVKNVARRFDEAVLTVPSSLTVGETFASR